MVSAKIKWRGADKVLKPGRCTNVLGQMRQQGVGATETIFAVGPAA